MPVQLVMCNVGLKHAARVRGPFCICLSHPGQDICPQHNILLCNCSARFHHYLCLCKALYLRRDVRTLYQNGTGVKSAVMT